MTRYAPCGHAVDIGRRPYKTQCRFLRDHDTVSEIRWIECKADAPVLPYWSGIESLSMTKDPWQLTGLGEVYGAPQTFTGQRAPDGFDGSHLCGSQTDFELGGAYLPDIPPAPYDPQGFLECCMVAPPPPPPPPPGCACVEATPITLPTDQIVSMCVVGPLSYIRWWRFEVTVSGLMNFKFTPDPFLTNFTGTLLRGTCGGLTLLWSFANNVTVNAWPVTPGTYFIIFNGSNSTANSARLEVSAVY